MRIGVWSDPFAAPHVPTACVRGARSERFLSGGALNNTLSTDNFLIWRSVLSHWSRDTAS